MRRESVKGWMVDRDGWYLRALRDGDQNESRVDRSMGFFDKGFVYVRYASSARQFDRGEPVTFA